MSRRLFKGVFIFLLIFTAFHLSGMELAFCDDGVSSVEQSSHGCSICHPGSHSVIFDQSMSIRIVDFVSPVFIEYNALKTQEPAFYFFRPPISA